MPAAYKSPTVLVVDDEPDLLLLIELTLSKLGLEVIKAGNLRRARAVLEQHKRAEIHIDLCLTDMQLGDGTGLDLIADIQLNALDIPTAVITAYGSPDNAVAALKAGAFDYLAKPVSLDQLRTLVKSVLNVTPTKAIAQQQRGFIGDSAAIGKLRDTIARLAKNLSPVHISGESGTGKELAARLLHDSGNRAKGPFIAVNCGAIPETLMESEFFGYKKGSFTGADRDRDGFFQAADGGTLFLDEVADLPLSMQVKLLRVIQERKVRKVGEAQEEPIDVRIVSATHKSLTDMVQAGDFRQDLLYRLNVIQLSMPPLRELRDDLVEIAEHLLLKITRGDPCRLETSAQQALIGYSFPGNVRELENILERAHALAENPQFLTAQDLQLQPSDRAPIANEQQDISPILQGRMTLQDFLDDVERKLLLQALDTTQQNRTQAAKSLGITFRSMRYRLERLGMAKE
jgi:two-component system, NtrC family, response regulator PilR